MPPTPASDTACPATPAANFRSLFSRLSFTTRLTLVLAALLLSYAVGVALLSRQVAHQHEQETLQRLSHGLAAHIVGHWPELGPDSPDPAAPANVAARQALLQMLMVVNPGIQVYLLDAGGRVQAYLGDASSVRQPQVELQPVRDFLAGAALPLRGVDPMGGGEPRIFSAAMFPIQPGQDRPPGYLYVVLDGGARAEVAGQISLRRVWWGAALAGAVGLLATLALGALTFGRLTRPLHRLAARLRAYQLQSRATAGSDGPPAALHPALPADGDSCGDEIAALAQAYDGMTLRIAEQSAREHQQAGAHREMMASVAHDLRTPLTALHGHLEALASPALEGAAQRGPVLNAALAQSNKVRRLSQQLFELAALQSDHQALHRERFNLDELVTDTVQKFSLGSQPPPVLLHGEAPGALALDGDWQLIERALTNLIDNALRHAPSGAPVRVSLRRAGAQALVLVEDAGPGLPPELLSRLQQRQSLRDPPLKRSGGGIGGLGLAIAQRVAQLHGGSLLPQPAQQGGASLCLALPLAA